MLYHPVCPGVPPRRIWLELKKLNAAEALQPGVWAKTVKLAYHLGLLPHLFPWLKGNDATQQQAAVVATKLTAAMPTELRVAAMVHPGADASAYQQVRLSASSGTEDLARRACTRSSTCSNALWSSCMSFCKIVRWVIQLWCECGIVGCLCLWLCK